MAFVKIAKKKFRWIACEPTPAPKLALLATNLKMILKYRLAIYLLLPAILIFVDQASKYAARTNNLLFFRNPICNSGIAFGLHLPIFLFWIFWSAAMIFLILILYKRDSFYESFFIVVICAGTLSNIFDRLKFGCVTDFIDLPMWPARIAAQSIAGWPVFNIADVYITIGALAIMMKILLKK